MRIVYLCLGCLMVATGVVGAFLPVLPTTPFLLLALWCFSKSSPRLEAWLLNHPRFGKSLRNWREHGAIPRRAKIAAVSLMTMSYLFYLIIMAPMALHALIVAVVMIGAGTFIVTRPSPPKD
ncbi:YbaN family protein [Agrobacterium cavarae]|uniref:YbaN family protein n=1 Tax=Agrobacterium cavarae TaxID=2528239 RepID=UPI0028A64186|nr:YbaN family protein [Agrobacterium cavarae]